MQFPSLVKRTPNSNAKHTHTQDKHRKMGKSAQLAEVLGTLEGFTVKENWDRFFTIRGSDNAFEWYEDWSELQAPLLSHLPNPTTPNTRAGLWDFPPL